MKISARNIIFSDTGFVIGACLIGLGCLALLGFVFLENNHHYEAAAQSYRETSHSDALRVKDRIETTFQDIYQSLRTISKFPSVRARAQHAEPAFTDMITLQEMYNNLQSHVAVSGLYIVPKSSRADSVAAANESAILFDQFIIGSTLESYHPLSQSDKETEAQPYIYTLIAQHGAQFAQRFPTTKKISGLDVPAISGQEENITGDDAASSLPNFLDNDRSGIVYSLPYYDMDGQFQGTISAVFLSRILRNLLPEGHYALFHSAHHRNILCNKLSDFLKDSLPWIEKEVPNPDLIYSETLPLSVQDASGEWVLWVGFPDADFKNAKGSAILKNSFIACGVIVSFGIGALFMLLQFSRIHQLEKSKLTSAKEKAEAIIQEKNALVANIIENAVDGMITINENGIMQIFNPAAEKIFGYTAQEAIGRNVSMLMPEPYHSQHDSYLSQYQRTGESKIIGVGREVKGKRKDGTLFTMRLAISEVKTGGARIYCGTVRDISDRKKIEAQVMEATEKLRVIFNHIGEGIYGVNTKGQTVFGNKAAAELLGYTLEEMFNKSQHDLIHHHRADGSPYPVEECNIYHAFKDGKIHKEDKEVFWRKDGSSFPVEYTSAPMRDAQGNITGAVVIFRDISGRQ